MYDGIIIGIPKKVTQGDLAGMYVCEVYLPGQEKKAPFYSNVPDETTSHAKKFVQAYLQQKIDRLKNYLKAKDIKQELTKELDWANQELAKNKD